MGDAFELLDVRNTPVIVSAEARNIGQLDKFFGITLARIPASAAIGCAGRPAAIAGVAAVLGVGVRAAAPPAAGFDLPHEAGDVVVRARPVVSRAAKGCAGRERRADIANLRKAETGSAVSRAVERRVGVAALAAILLRDVGTAAGAAGVVAGQRPTAEGDPGVVQAA